MGYTHYWERPDESEFEPPSDDQWDRFVREVRKYVSAVQSKGIEIVNGMGEEGTDPEFTDKYINFNGEGDQAHENLFFLRDPYTFHEENDTFGSPDFAFTKTARKPYDSLVGASLLSARRIFDGSILSTVRSDGFDLELYETFLDESILSDARGMEWMRLDDQWAGGINLYEALNDDVPKPVDLSKLEADSGVIITVGHQDHPDNPSVRTNRIRHGLSRLKESSQKYAFDREWDWETDLLDDEKQTRVITGTLNGTQDCLEISRPDTDPLVDQYGTSFEQTDQRIIDEYDIRHEKMNDQRKRKINEATVPNLASSFPIDCESENDPQTKGVSP